MEANSLSAHHRYTDLPASSTKMPAERLLAPPRDRHMHCRENMTNTGRDAVHRRKLRTLQSRTDVPAPMYLRVADSGLCLRLYQTDDAQPGNEAHFSRAETGRPGRSERRQSQSAMAT